MNSRASWPSVLKLPRREIGDGRPVYIVAEMSGNHGQDFGRAEAIVRAAAECGADAVKLQTYTADTLTIDCRGDLFVVGAGSPWQGRTLYDLYREAHTPWEWQPRLKGIAEGLGLDLFSTPFDETAVDFLDRMGTAVYKVASFELVDHALLRKVARTGKPVILSTGMASEEEIREAVDVLRAADCGGLALLKCTSAYPASPADANLRTIPDMRARFGCPVGLSDHTAGVAVPVAAVSLGASIVEKHLTLRRADGGPDAAFSLEPSEFAAMVKAVRAAEQALGGIRYGGTPAEDRSRAFRRSLFVVRDMAAGETFTRENVRSIRPGYGLPPGELDSVLGRRARAGILRGTPLTRELVD